MNDPSKHDKHNSSVLEKYSSSRSDVSYITLEYFSQISKGLTHVCSCLNQEIKITETKTINQEIKITETRTKFIKSGNQNKMLIRKTKSTIIK